MLVGDPVLLGAALNPLPAAVRERAEIIAASQVVSMEEKPREAIRRKKDSSMRLAVDLVHCCTRGAPRVQQYSVDVQRELPGAMSLSVGYTGLTGSNLSWAGSNAGSTAGYININQIDPQYQNLPADYTLANVPNPFFGIAAAGQLANQALIARGQLMRPYPQFGNVYMEMSTGAHSQYHAGIVQLRKRVTGIWGGKFSYTYSRLNDNQWGETNYYSSNPGIQNNYEMIPGSANYNPDLEYGRSLLDSPHKLVLAPTVMVPLGKGHKLLANSTIGDLLLGGWSITPVVTLQSGFPIGVTQLSRPATRSCSAARPVPT